MKPIFFSKAAMLGVLLAMLSGCAHEETVSYGLREHYDKYGQAGAQFDESRVRAMMTAKLAAQVPAGFDGPVRPFAMPLPGYPVAARRRGIEGTVVVRIVFDESGKMKESFIMSSPDELLGDEVTRVVKGWQIQPMTKKGMPSKFVLEQEFPFAL